MHNACGISFLPSAHEDGHDREAAVMAWMLQGLEAAFIHSLTILGAESDEFSVIANEHDGCILRMETGEESFQEALTEAIAVARHMSGFHEAELVEKAFADEEDVEALYDDNSQEADEGSREAGFPDIPTGDSVPAETDPPVPAPDGKNQTRAKEEATATSSLSGSQM